MPKYLNVYLHRFFLLMNAIKFITFNLNVFVIYFAHDVCYDAVTVNAKAIENWHITFGINKFWVMHCGSHETSS